MTLDEKPILSAVVHLSMVIAMFALLTFVVVDATCRAVEIDPTPEVELGDAHNARD